MIGEIHGCLPQAVCNQVNPSVLETTFSANVEVANGFLSISCCESDNCNSVIIPGKKKKYIYIFFIQYRHLLSCHFGFTLEMVLYTVYVY